MDISILKSKRPPQERVFEQAPLSYMLNNDLPQERINGRRYYVTPAGNKYPSVTTFLKCFQDNTQLDKWKRRVGEAEAERISRRSCDRGEAIHLALEHRLLNKPNQIETVPEEFRHMYKQIENSIRKYLDSYVYMEHALYSDELKIAGRADLCGYWMGKLSIIDFKNKNRKPSNDTLHHYMLQAATYAIMHEHCYGEVIDNLVIIAAIEGATAEDALVYQRDARPYKDEVLTMVQTFRSAHPEYYDLTERATKREVKQDNKPATFSLF